MRLVYKKTQLPMNIGDKVLLPPFAEQATVTYFREPHKPSSEGKMSVRYGSGGEREFYVSVIGAEWIEREDRE